MRVNHRIYTTLLLGLSSLLAGCGGEPPTAAVPARPTILVTPPPRSSGGTVEPLRSVGPAQPSSAEPTRAATVVPPLPAPSPATLATAVPTPSVASPTTLGTPIPPTAAPSAIPATPTALPTEAALAPEQNPLGDIGDSQVFVTYTAPDGSYQVEVPEGWGRTGDGTTVTFQDKLDGVAVTLAAADQAPTTASVRAAQVPALQAGERAVQVTAVREVTLPGGAAVVLEYQSNSEPNAVTGKQIRRENAAYLFFRAGRLATLHLWAPAGADNVDQWQRMAQSFRWR
ncbi:MAG: hypothetical protein M3Z04_02495 [Chloroflexota bacterium]|nr:hypothetical protein [Chloroflexota bacterium]